MAANDKDNDYMPAEAFSGEGTAATATMNQISSDVGIGLLNCPINTPRKQGRLLTSKSNGNMLSSIGPELETLNMTK